MWLPFLAGVAQGVTLFLMEVVSAPKPNARRSRPARDSDTD